MIHLHVETIKEAKFNGDRKTNQEQHKGIKQITKLKILN